MTANLIEHFSLLEDPRIDRNKCHALIDIIVLTVCAVASGADGWESIEQSAALPNQKVHVVSGQDRGPRT